MAFGLLHRVVRVHAVHLRGLQQQVRVDLDGAQRRRGVGGEERIAGAGRENDDAILLQMAHGAAADVVLAHLVDADGGHHARVQPEALERVLHGERVHHGGEHAHVVAGDAIHAGAREARAAEDVAAADDDGDLARPSPRAPAARAAMRLMTAGSMP